MARRDNEQLSIAALIAEGRTALVAGEKPRAQALLQAAVRKEPDNVEAWLWLSGAHSVPEDIAYCLRKVLLLDPGNEQAREGLVWLAQTHGIAVPSAFAAEPASSREQTPLSRQPLTPYSHASPPVRTVDERQAERRLAAAHAQQAAIAAVREQAALRIRAFEMVFYVGGVGAVIGILRLLGALRPSTLLLIRGSAGPIVSVDAFLLVFGTALAHALALILAWLVLGLPLVRARNDRQGAIADTLERAGGTLLPGYLFLGGVVLAALSLGWSEQRWLPVAGMIWALLIVGMALIGRGILRLFDLMRISQYRRTMHLIRLIGPAVVVAAVGLVIAGIAMRSLLRTL